MRYYRNPDGRCFATSLANVLLLCGESHLAEKVFTEYPTHPLTTGQRDGCLSAFIGHVPKLVHDLTGGEYYGQVRLTSNVSLKYTMKEFFFDRPLSRVVGNVVAYGSAVTRSDVLFHQPLPNQMSAGHPYFETPTIVITKGMTRGKVLRDLEGKLFSGTLTRGDEGHALVALPNGLHIDNGWTVEHLAAYTFLGHVELNRS